ncbi:major histocompatibility complex class I-related gene protein-like isoform X2 [Rhineura floridana]|uniref:major histocompatibility complex class I-related gene protein-like isoform X2 n=1 Tax=Rhineura floridana TaxID=261503 RepID=UPI002AC7EFAC|nr:major histocompatibility complex class I-related gene protein-like isoform X2 [Rhineura floridana]
MGRLRWPPWTLCATFLLLGCPGSSSHYFHNFYIGVSEPGQGLPQFIAVSYVDDQPITHYDSDTQRKVPVMPWMRKVEKDDAQYWDRGTEALRGWEQAFQVNLVTLGNRYNQSNGFHSLQVMYGCEVGPEGRKGGYLQHGYDGRDFLSLDKETLTWTAADAGAQVTKRKWERDRAFTQYTKAYLEEECVEWLKKYLDYGKEALQRTEPPVVKVTHQVDADDMETLFCQAHGFYPKEIDANWRKDGKVWVEDTFRGVVAPNSDGTYHALLGVKIDPKDRDRYRCHVEHDGLKKPLKVAWEEPAAKIALILGCVLGAIVLIASGIAGIMLYRKWQAGYKEAPTSDRGSDNSSQGSNPAV